MGDISELRGLIVVVTFLGVTGLLIAWMPSQLYAGGEYHEVYVPEVFEGMDIYNFVDTANTPMNETQGWTYPLDTSWYICEPDDDGEGDPEIGGRNVNMWYKKANESGLAVKHEHLYGAFIFTFSHFMKHYDRNGIDRGTHLEVAEIQDNSEDNQTSRFKVQCRHFHMTAIFNFNYTKWGNFTNAWNHNELYVFHGIDFDQSSTGYNAWDLIAKLLFFQMPAGIPFYINAILAIPIWVATAYIVVILVYRTIGAVFGGGA